MSICPKCNEVTEELRSEATATTNALMDEEGNVIIDNENDDIFKTYEWRCPECNAIISKDEEGARNFILHKDKLKQMVENKIKNDRHKKGSNKQTER